MKKYFFVQILLLSLWNKSKKIMTVSSLSYVALVNADDVEKINPELNFYPRYGVKGERFGTYFLSEDLKAAIGDEKMRQFECDYITRLLETKDVYTF